MDEREKYSQVEIDRMKKESRDLGARSLGPFTVMTHQSNVPEQFYDAVLNIGSHIELSNHPEVELITRLLGIALNSEDAIYIIAYGNAVSLHRKLLDPAIDPDRRSEITMLRDEMIGHSLRFASHVLYSNSNSLIRIFHRRPDRNALVYLRGLQERLETQVTKPQVHARIILFGNPRKI